MFDRLEKIIDQKDLNRIQNLNIAIIGIGGVGGSTFESLVRFGIKNITIIDHDSISLSNINRQIISLHSNIGEFKVEVAKKRALYINPDINVTCVKEFLNNENISVILNQNYDYIVDACDTITTKLEIIKFCQSNHVNLISCMGTGNRFDPTKLEITKLPKTYNDPLAKIIRKLVRDNKLSDNINVIWSSETPIKISSRTPGSNSLVPNVAGIFAASYIINDILK